MSGHRVGTGRWDCWVKVLGRSVGIGRTGRWDVALGRLVGTGRWDVPLGQGVETGRGVSQPYHSLLYYDEEFRLFNDRPLVDTFSVDTCGAEWSTSAPLH